MDKGTVNGVQGSIGGHIDPASQQCIDLLEKVLADAKSGKVQTIGIVACGQGGFGPGFAGSNMVELNLGLDIIKTQIIGMLLQQSAAAQQRKPHILRPGQR